MMTRTIAFAAGVTGLVLLVVRLVTDGGVALQAGGLACLAISLAAWGALLASGSLVWLRTVVAMAVPLLAASLLLTAYSVVSEPQADVLAGVVVALAGLMTWTRRPRTARVEAVRGRHSA